MSASASKRRPPRSTQTRPYADRVSDAEPAGRRLPPGRRSVALTIFGLTVIQLAIAAFVPEPRAVRRQRICGATDRYPAMMLIAAGRVPAVVAAHGERTRGHTVGRLRADLAARS